MRTLFTKQSCFQISNSLAWQVEQTNNYVYIIDLANQQIYKFNDVAGDIWKLICDKKNRDEIYKEISLVYNVDINEVKEDIDDFITELLESNLIV